MPLVSAWLVSSILGLIVSTIGMLLGIGDVIWARKMRGADAREYRLVAYQRLYAQLARAVIFGFWAWIGLLTIGTEPRIGVLVAVLILGNIILASVAVTDLLVGVYVRRARGGNSVISD